jgi:protein TonB
MNKVLFLLIAVLGIQFASAQEERVKQELPANDDSIYNTSGIEVRPEYPGGIDAFYKFISKNYNPPSDRAFKGGKVFVTFVIEKDGSLTEIKVIRDPGFRTADEAIRVLQLCEKWKPGEQNGRFVRTQFALPIVLPSN